MLCNEILKFKTYKIVSSLKIYVLMIFCVKKVQPRDSKLRTKDNAQAHKSSSKFEIAAFFQIIKVEQSGIGKS